MKCDLCGRTINTLESGTTPKEVLVTERIDDWNKTTETYIMDEACANKTAEEAVPAALERQVLITDLTT